MDANLKRTGQKTVKVKRTPTIDQSKVYQDLYDYFNKNLFDNKLPPVILNFSRKSRAYGFFIPREIWIKRNSVKVKKTISEISINPDYLNKSSLKERCSTLVHEMVHYWQFLYGKPGKGGYHNKEFARKMERIGLMTSSTGKEGGERIGRQMSHYVIKNDTFDLVYRRLTSWKVFPWVTGYSFKPGQPTGSGKADEPSGAGAEVISKNKLKTTYECETCGTKVWGKADLYIICGNCQTDFKPAE